MRYYPAITAVAMALLLTACGDGDEGTHVVSSPVREPSPPPAAVTATAPQRFYLSPYALTCPTRFAVEETLDYLRRSLGHGELRKNCTITAATGLTEVLVDQQEVARLKEAGENSDRILAWKAFDSDDKGWTPMSFLDTGVGGFYPLSLRGAAPQVRVRAFTELEQLRAMVSVEAGTAEYNDLDSDFRRQQAFSLKAVDNRPLEVMALADGEDYLGTRIMLAQWRFAGEDTVYWTPLADLFATDSARAELASHLGGY